MSSQEWSGDQAVGHSRPPTPLRLSQKKNRIKGGMQQWKIRLDVYKKREKEEKERRQVRMKKSREIQKEGKSEKRGREMENGRETVKKERLERR